MNKQIATLLISAGLLTTLPTWADDWGINVILEGEVTPGVYGRVELGNDSRPDIYYPHPMLVVKDSRYSKYKPAYLHVPPGHAKHWDKHCQKYNACGRPVYFIKSQEYEESYQREHQHDHDRDNDRDRDNKKSDSKNGQKEKGQGHSKKNDKH